MILHTATESLQRQMTRCTFCNASAIFLLAVFQWCACNAQTKPVLDADAVNVVQTGKSFVVNADFYLPESAQQAFSVFSDYDHMVNYSPNMRVSEVLSRDGDILKLHQIMTVRVVFLSLDFESVREVRLDPPHKITAHGISGDFIRAESSVTFESEGTGTRVHYHAESEPKLGLPPFIGPVLIKQQATDQFSAFIREIQRRH